MVRIDRQGPSQLADGPFDVSALEADETLYDAGKARTCVEAQRPGSVIRRLLQVSVLRLNAKLEVLDAYVAHGGEQEIVLPDNGEPISDVLRCTVETSLAVSAQLLNSPVVAVI